MNKVDALVASAFYIKQYLREYVEFRSSHSDRCSSWLPSLSEPIDADFNQSGIIASKGKIEKIRYSGTCCFGVESALWRCGFELLQAEVAVFHKGSLSQADHRLADEKLNSSTTTLNSLHGENSGRILSSAGYPC